MSSPAFAQTEHARRRGCRGCLITVVILSVLVAAVIALYPGGCFYIATGDDAQEAGQFCDALISKHPPLEDKGGSTLFWAPRSRYIHLTLYDDYSPEERAMILGFAREVRRELGTRAVRVTFYSQGREVQDEILD